MGIKGLTKFIADYAPGSLKQTDMASLAGRILAIDASMSLYQFMIAIRDGDSFMNLTNQSGDATSHILGMLSRAVRLMENGIKPVYVFDGKPPVLKGGELAKRKQKRELAETGLELAQEMGDRDEIKKQISRTVKITKEHNQDIKTLLSLMGVPVVEAPCEAEAQCAELAKSGKVYATATEDADALTFGTPILIRNLNFSENKLRGNPILRIQLDSLLEQLKFDTPQFVDFCILCGCDYTDGIRGIGAKTAYSLIQQHKSIDKIVSSLDQTKYTIPEPFPYEEARDFFFNPEVTKGEDVVLKWKEADVEGLKKFLVEDHNFSEQRIDNYIVRLKKAWGKQTQTRLESFFGACVVKSSSKTHEAADKNVNKENSSLLPLKGRGSKVTTISKRKLEANKEAVKKQKTNAVQKKPSL